MHFTPHYPGAVAAFKGEAAFTLDYSRDRILHCLEQLSESQLWHRPHPSMNAVGNIVLHVCGNLTQWITVGCDPMQSVEDRRDRPAEFSVTGGHNPGQLAQRLREAVDDAKETLEQLNKDDLLEAHTIQGFHPTGMGAIWHSVAHLEGHAQETIYATRLMLGDEYRFQCQY